MALYHNALLALLGMEGVPVLLYGSEQNVMGRPPPPDMKDELEAHRSPLWHAGYDTKGQTFTYIKRVLWLRKHYQGLHKFSAQIIVSDHQWLVFSRGPLLFVLTNVGGVHQSYHQRVLWPNSTTIGCQSRRVCDVLNGDCTVLTPGIAVHMEIANGHPKLYVSDDLFHQIMKNEETQAQQEVPLQMPATTRIQLLMQHEWIKVQPSPPYVASLHMVARSPRTVLPAGVK